MSVGVVMLLNPIPLKAEVILNLFQDLTVYVSEFTSLFHILSKRKP